MVILATDENGKYICVRQFRQGVGRVTTEFPAGGLERTDRTQAGSGGHLFSLEDATAAARRELREETGYEADELVHLITLPANATISDNTVFLFMAKNCRKVSAQELDETEFLNVELLSQEELERRIYCGRLSRLIMCWPGIWPESG